MKAVVDHEKLREKLALLKTAVPRPPQIIPILKHVAVACDIDILRLACTDLETTAITSVDATVTVVGGFTVDLAALSDVAKVATEPLALNHEKDVLRITCGGAKWELPTLKIDDFPTLPDVNDGSSETMSASEFLPMLRSVSYAMLPDDEIRQSLSAVAVRFMKKRLDVLALDGSRMGLARRSWRGNKDATVMLHAGLVRASKALGVSEDGTDVTVLWNDNHAGLSLGRDTLLHRSVDANVIDYDSYLERHKTPAAEVLVTVADLQSRLASVKPFAADRGVVVMNVSRGSLDLSCENVHRGRGRAQLAVEYSGDSFVSGYRAGSLIDALESIPTQRAMLHFHTSEQAKDGAGPELRITPFESTSDIDYLHMIAAMRID